jgi:hypothetical protein
MKMEQTECSETLASSMKMEQTECSETLASSIKMEQTECSEASAYKIQTPGNYPEESIQHSQHGESLKSRKDNFCFLIKTAMYLFIKFVYMGVRGKPRMYCSLLAYCTVFIKFMFVTL